MGGEACFVRRGAIRVQRLLLHRAHRRPVAAAGRGRRPSQPVCSGAGGRSALAVVPVLFCPFRPLKGRRQLGVIVYRRSRIWLAEFGG